MDWRTKINGIDNNSGNMYWLQKMNRAIDYIEDNLLEEIDYSKAARLAYCSAHHFQRMFAFIADISISEYIRRRRLTLAAFELQSTDIKVIDVATKYGYDSPESFTRAFRHLHGVIPSSVKDKNVNLKAYPRITFHISIKGDTVMDYRIEQREEIEVFGVEQVINTIDHLDFYEVPKFWRKCHEDGSIRKLQAIAGISVDTPVHSALHDCTDTQYTYMICCIVPPTKDIGDYTRLTVPGGTWAVFPTEILSKEEVAMQAAQLWKRIFTEWFASSGYELAHAPEMEMHFNKGDSKYLTEIWVPITTATKVV
jgi:AraC family transcriptional regulator